MTYQPPHRRTPTPTTQPPNPQPPVGLNLADFAGFSNASTPSGATTPRSRATSRSRPDPEVTRLERSLKIAKLKAELAELQSDQTHLVVTPEGEALPANNEAAKPHRGAIDTKTGYSRKRAVVQLNFRLAERKFGILSQKFPGVIFTQPDFGGHDHPVAHVETVMGTRRLQSLIPAGERVLDLYGNPTANESFNRLQSRRDAAKHVDTLVSVMTAKDELRKAMKFGPQTSSTGTERYWDQGGASLRQTLDNFQSVQRIGEYDSLLSVHTLYYFGREDIASLLNVRPGQILRALVIRHKHSATPYRLFDEEVEVTCGPIIGDAYDFEVAQRNVETNERYSHLSLEWLWRSTTKTYIASNGEAFTWDLQKFTDESWIVTLVACNPALDEGYARREEASGPRIVAHAANVRDLAEEHTAKVEFPVGKIAHVRGVAVLSLPSEETREFRITNPDFYNMLRKHVSGKQRDDKLYKQLTALASRETDKDNNYPGGRKYVVEPSDVSDHVVAAFLADIKREVFNLETMAACGVDIKRQRRLFNLATHSVTAKSDMGTTIDAAARVSASLFRHLGKGGMAGIAENLAE